MTITKEITARLIASKKRFHANDNISEFIKEGELELLEKELTEKFEEVLTTLIIDTQTDPNSKGTAKRLARMYLDEVMWGRYFPPPKVAAFPNDGSHGTAPYKGMLVVRAELNSMCSHHHQPVTGVAFIGIIPGDKVIGLSKYVRVAQHCARRGTLQEELCGDIANAIMKATQSGDVAVYIEAEHGCCTNRGIMAKSSLTQTTVLHGDFLNDASVKKEFFDNIHLQKFQCN